MRLLVIGLLAISVSAFAADVYVAPGGDDGAAGTQEAPVASVAKAIELIAPGTTVHLAPGTYTLDETLTLGAAQGGTADAPVKIVAMEKGTARLMGGRIVSNFAKVTDEAVLAKLDESARGEVFAADLTAMGVTDFGAVNSGSIELFFDGKPMELSRWPNEGFVKIVEVKGGEPYDIRGTVGDKVGKWVYDGERPSRWVSEKDGWLYGYWFWDWSAQHQRIKAITPEEHLIEVDEPYHGYGFRNGQWYYALNLLSEIDRPGEWYVDRDAGMLYFWPPAAIDSAEAFVSVLPTAVSIIGADYVTLEGVVMEGLRDTVVTVRDSSHCRVVACTVRNSGNGAISIAGGMDDGVVGCDIYNVAASGISLNGGDRATLTPAGHFADNNHIYDYARVFRMYNGAIALDGVGNRAAHNLIHDAPHTAIFFGGNDHVIEYNEIHDVCYESNDAGAIYAGRDWTMRGTEIRYNFLHNIMGFEDRGCVGVYLDDMYCGTNIHDNVFYKVHWAAFIGGGRDNRYVNNLFVDCPMALHIDARATNWAADHVATTMTERLNAMPFTESPWKERFPELLTIMEDEPAAPKGNVIEKNVFYGENWNHVTDDAKPYVTLGTNLENVDPQLVKPKPAKGALPKATDFAVKEDSPALGMGFEKLPLEKMGLTEALPRATWPVAHGVREK
jgi:hypothetical protein